MSGDHSRPQALQRSSPCRSWRFMATDRLPSSTSSSDVDESMRATSVRSARRWSVGFVLPRMLIVCILIDGLLRFAPSAWRPMEPGEAAVRYRFPDEAYARNLRAQSSAAYAD